MTSKFFHTGKSNWLAAALAALMLLATGCVAVVTPFDNNTQQLREQESLADFTDVPYPSHMTLDKKNSLSYERRGILAGVLVAAGRMNIEEAAAYFDAHLPGHGWRPVAEAQTGTLVSTWQKDQRILTIIAKPSSLSLGSDLRLEMWVGAPLSFDDLGKRTFYKKSTTGQQTPITTPIGPIKIGGSSSGSGSSSSPDITEEDL